MFSFLADKKIKMVQIQIRFGFNNDNMITLYQPRYTNHIMSIDYHSIKVKIKLNLLQLPSRLVF